MYRFDKDNKRLCSQFEEIQWIESSGVSPEKLQEMCNDLMHSSQNTPKCITKAKLFDTIARYSRIALDIDDIFQDKLFGRNIINQIRWSWEQ